MCRFELDAGTGPTVECHSTVGPVRVTANKMPLFIRQYVLYGYDQVCRDKQRRVVHAFVKLLRTTRRNGHTCLNRKTSENVYACIQSKAKLSLCTP
jgi:hypothetical protein